MDPRVLLPSFSEGGTDGILEKAFCSSTGETSASKGAYNTAAFSKLKWLGPSAVSRQMNGTRPLRTAFKLPPKSNECSTSGCDSSAGIERSNTTTAYVVRNVPMVLEGVNSFCKKTQPPVLTLSLKRRVEQPRESSNTTRAFWLQGRQRSLRQQPRLRKSISEEPHFAGPICQWEVKRETSNYGDVPPKLREAGGARGEGEDSNEGSTREFGESNDQQGIRLRVTPRSEHLPEALMRESRSFLSGDVMSPHQRVEDSILSSGALPDEKGSNHCTSSSVSSGDTGQHKWSISSSRGGHQASPVGSEDAACAPLDQARTNKGRTSVSSRDRSSESNGNDRTAGEAPSETTSVHDEQSQSRVKGRVPRKLPCIDEAPHGADNATELRQSQGEAGQWIPAARLKGWWRAPIVKSRFASRQARSSGVIAAKRLSALGAPTRGRRASVRVDGGHESPSSSNSEAEGDHSEATRSLMWQAESFEGASWLNPSNKECERSHCWLKSSILSSGNDYQMKKRLQVRFCRMLEEVLLGLD
ncbi:hypothetical protein Emed_003660 [Eimeria media]